MKNPSNANLFMLFFMVYSIFVMFIVSFISEFLNIENLMNIIFMFNHVIMFGIPLAIFALLKKIPFRQIAPFRHLDLKNTLLTIGIAFFIMPIMNLIAAITSLFTDNEVNAVIYEYIENLPFWMCFLSTAIMPAIFEEITFRGLILNGYKRTGLGTAIAMSALFFGIMHMDSYQFFYATAAGAIFGVLVYYSGSIYTSMLAHLIINGSQIILAKLAQMLNLLETVVETEVTYQDSLMSIVYCVFIFVITLPFLVAMLVAFIRHNKDKNHDYIYDLEAAEFSVDISQNQTKIIDLPVILVITIFLIYILIQSFQSFV